MTHVVRVGWANVDKDLKRGGPYTILFVPLDSPAPYMTDYPHFALFAGTPLSPEPYSGYRAAVKAIQEFDDIR